MTYEFKLKVMHAKLLWGGFYRCPNSGEILVRLPHDDKVLCGCGKANPAVRGDPGEHGVHIVSFLTAVSAEEYVAQEDARRKKTPE